MSSNYSYSSNYAKPPKRRGKRLLRLLMLLVLLTAAGFAVLKITGKNPELTSILPITQPQPEAPAVQSLEGRYFFAGTIVLARAVERGAAGDYNQPFSGMSTFGMEKYDAGVADLECPVTTNNVSYDQQVANLVFNCRPEWLPTFSKYFQVVNLAGNHTYDMGSEGFPETVDHLQKAGIQAVGHYSPRVKKDICEVVSLPVRVKKSDGQEEKGGLPIAFCSWHYFSFSPEAGEIETMQRYSKIMPVFGLMHAGTEYLARAQSNQVDLAHRIIDAGPPEFLIGNSPHWVQNTEVYNGKLIAYSTGNFIFDQLDYETQRGANFDITMKVEYDDNVAKWLALGQQCEAREDTCLEEAEKQGLTKIKTNYTYEAVASSGGNKKVAKKADAALQKATEERLEWSQSLSKLKNSSSQ